MPLPVTPVIVTFNSAHVLAPCLASLRGETAQPIVIDNAGADGAAALAQTLGARVKVNARNQGFGRAMNIGAAMAETEFLLLANPDLTFDEGAIAALCQAACDYPQASLFGPRLIEPDGRVFYPAGSLLEAKPRNAKGPAPLPEGDCSLPFLSGACYLVRRAAFEAIGGFDPQIFLFYEDDDLCRRFADAGAPPVYVHAAIVRHTRGQSSAPARGRAYKARWHLAWSRAYVARKYGLRAGSAGTIFKSGFKYLPALATRDAARRERHGGTLAGAFAAMRGLSALEKEGLDSPVV
jgi:N-acetylglucosaminyl-diphospho-decaprenol L-rhamnosyltransferase